MDILEAHFYKVVPIQFQPGEAAVGYILKGIENRRCFLPFRQRSGELLGDMSVSIVAGVELGIKMFGLLGNQLRSLAFRIR